MSKLAEKWSSIGGFNLKEKDNDNKGQSEAGRRLVRRHEQD
jgi:hypothetical protein